MSAPRAPRLEERRTAEFAAELRARARAWMPGWGIADGEADVGAALLDIAARFSAEVAERLDRGGEKMRRGFLDWLAVRGTAARPARMPVVFKLADAARESVLAEAPVRLQADANGTGVVFETEHDVRVVPGRLKVVVGVDAGTDQFYLAPPDLYDLTPHEPVPVQWELKSFAEAGSRTLQLDPDSGLVAEMIIDAGGKDYRILQVDKGIVTIEPALDGDLSTPLTVRTVTSFAPFDGVARNRQEHALYLGDMDLLHIDAKATIDVIGATALVSGITWQYWGKVDDKDEVAWQRMNVATIQDAPGAVRLEKPKGAVEPREIGAGNSSRWIRAYAASATGSAPMLRVDALELKVNCTDPPVCQKDAARASPAAEAMANTTPIVLDSIFFPLGKEPRQFDAFYLGSQEAFSKKDAKVQLCFELADPTFTSLSAVHQGAFANGVLAGVAADRALHLFAFSVATGALDKFLGREPLQPPLPGYEGSAVAGPMVALDPQPPYRLPVWSEPESVLFGTVDGFVVAVSAGDAVWLWREKVSDRNASGWISLGDVPATAVTPSRRMAGMVYLADQNAPQLVALRNGQMSVRPRLGAQPWVAVPTTSVGVPVTLERIAPVLAPNAQEQLFSSVVDGLVGISSGGNLFSVAIGGACTMVLPGRTFRPDVQPVAVKDLAHGLVIVAVDAATERLVAYRQIGGVELDVALHGSDVVVGGLDVTVIDGVIHVVATANDGGAGKLVTWAPFAAGAAGALLDSLITAAGTQAGGMATLIGTRVVIPGRHADVLVGEFGPSRRHVEQAAFQRGVVLPNTVSPLAVNDVIVRRVGNVASTALITAAGTAKDNETLYPIGSGFPSSASYLDAYRLVDANAGVFAAPDTFTLDPTDNETAANSWLWIDGEVYRFTNFDATVTPRVGTIACVTAVATPSAGSYVRPIATGGRVASFAQLARPGNGNWDPALLDHLPLVFPLLVPAQQRRGKAFTLGADGKPGIVVLDGELVNAANPVDFVIDEGVADWSRLLGDTSANPELSWEYWNGKGWWRLPVTRDDTRHFKSSGALRFTVPRDIASSDWAGKTNFWIRARLIGGDYGREKITAKSTVVGSVTEQTVERSSTGIRPPSVLTLSISYGVCTAVRPTFVIAQDSGSMKDQSSANRTAGALVEAFVPLAVTLGRLSDTPREDAAGHDCPPECGCQENHATVAAAPPPSTDDATAAPPAAARALYIGLDADPSGAPVNVLLLVDAERDHHAFAPMRVETLVADRFTSLVADDATRGLGASGLLTLAFTLPPTRRELFGQSLAWIRLVPAEGADIAQWKPALRGAYLNAVWASATETLTRELVGSSEGAPFLTLKLARPPVLHGTLDLRVREPLGDEERAALLRQDAQSVVSDVEGLRGDWVRWRQVTDPDDEPAQARAYALEEGTGTIRFGDGLHGMIPPIGLDSIVAFSYQRTEPPKGDSIVVPGNLIGARAPLNLVSPVESVERVVAADQAAGGAPPEADERVLRFGFARLRHRGRAVTARDVEDVALESSPDIVQARCVSRRGSVRLIVVMRGADPAPNAAQVRELRRLLLSSGPSAFAVPRALRIMGPDVHRLRVDLTLHVDALENAGALSEQVKQRVKKLLDTATGGIEQTGWPLGANPSNVDVALALLDTPHLQSIGDVVLLEILADGTERAWPDTLGATHLAVLDHDPIRLRFNTAEVPA